MLESLYVKDFAIVGEAEIAFGPGMTVVTGETGAGKSLLVDALLLLAGGRAEAVDGAPRLRARRTRRGVRPDRACRTCATGWSPRTSTRTAPASCAA